MKHILTKPSATHAELTITLDAKDLAPIKKAALAKLAKHVKVAGFRPGKIPANVAEKHIDPNTLQQEILEIAVNQYYIEAMLEAKLQPLDRPEIAVTKLVPDETAEFTAKVEVVPEIKLADYTKIKKTPAKVSIKATEVTEVLDRLQRQMAEKKEVDRAAKDGDEVLIDFAGKDADGKEVPGATGTNYPLSLGSKTFIDGFEENLIGLKPSDKKEFTLTFPKDYAHKPLANKKVTFAVTLKKVNELVLPTLDDDFAKKAGPFETLDDLKKDVKAELIRQQESTARNELKNDVIEEIIAKSTVPMPESLVKDQTQMVRQDVLQNLAYRGMTLDEYLKAEATTEEEWLKKEVTPAAEKRVATGLILSEIAKKEGIEVDTAEVHARLDELKRQYQEPKMRAQLDTTEARRDIESRLATEKTIDRILEIASSK
ncbi:MAG TPA: trigger factor [Candidatus Saccharimonadales bacterium]|nr:trigger factor [Candidatus Saccharimonadales bacterium]